MGRELKRIATNFEWPLNKIWEGYQNPWYEFQGKCEDCEGMGYAPQALEFYKQWYGYTYFNPVAYGSQLLTPVSPPIVEFCKRQIERNRDYFTNNGELNEVEAMLKEGTRLTDMWNNMWCHHLIQEDVDALFEDDYLLNYFPNGKPTVDEMNAWTILTPMSSGNSYAAIKGRCKRNNFEVYCPKCDGEGHIWYTEDAKQKCEEWESTEPPAGEGYQIWETVSEGSPISPVFSDPMLLAEWMANAPPWGAAQPMSADRWFKWITEIGWAVSGMYTPGKGYQDGVSALTE